MTRSDSFSFTMKQFVVGMVLGIVLSIAGTSVLDHPVRYVALDLVLIALLIWTGGLP